MLKMYANSKKGKANFWVKSRKMSEVVKPTITELLITKKKKKEL